jgi:hypothetical protein
MKKNANAALKLDQRKKPRARSHPNVERLEQKESLLPQPKRGVESAVNNTTKI